MTVNGEDVRGSIEALERALAAAMADLHLLTLISNLVLGILVEKRGESESIDLYFRLRRTVHRLQKETFRQAVILDGLKTRLAQYSGVSSTGLDLTSSASMSAARLECGDI